MAPPKSLKSCSVCRHTEKLGVRVVRKCSLCSKSFHEACRPMLVLESSPSNLRKKYICSLCEHHKPGLEAQDGTDHRVINGEDVQVPSVPLALSTPDSSNKAKLKTKASTSTTRAATKKVLTRAGAALPRTFKTTTKANKAAEKSLNPTADKDTSCPIDEPTGDQLEVPPSGQSTDQLDASVEKNGSVISSLSASRLSLFADHQRPPSSLRASTPAGAVAKRVANLQGSATSSSTSSRRSGTICRPDDIFEDNSADLINATGDTNRVTLRKLERYVSGLSAMAKEVTSLTAKLDDGFEALKVLPAMIFDIDTLKEKLSAQEVKIALQDAMLVELESSRALLNEECTTMAGRILRLEEQLRELAVSDRVSYNKVRNKAVNINNDRLDNNNKCDRTSMADAPLIGDSSAVISESDGFQTQVRRRRRMRTRHNQRDVECPVVRGEHAPPVDGTGSGETSTELIITNIFDGSDEQRSNVVFAMLGTVFPSISREDIVSTRLLRSDRRASVPAREGDAVTRSSPWVVRLSNQKILRDIMRAKMRFTGFNTGQINISSLDEETSNSLIRRKIFINEFLNKESFIQFNSLKKLARELGFKYVWHRGGRFLVKRRDGDSSHIIFSAADLHAIIVSSSRSVSGSVVMQVGETASGAVSNTESLVESQPISGQN